MYRAFLASAAAAALLLSPTAGWAETKKDTKGDETSGFVSVTGAAVDGRRQSAIFEEYRNVPDLGVDMRVDHRPDKDHVYEFIGTHIGLDDQYERFTAHKFGEWKFRAIYDEVPHRYSYDSRTIYSGEGTGLLTIDPALRAQLQAITQETPNVVGASPVAVGFAAGSRGAALVAAGQSRANALTIIRKQDLATALNAAPSRFIDVETLRERLTLQMDIASWDPGYLSAEFKNEEKSGFKPTLWTFGSSPGTPDVPEVAEPTNYNTKQYKVAGDYVKKKWSVGANYYRSKFEDKTPTLSFDNPFLTGNGVNTNFGFAPAGAANPGTNTRSDALTGGAARGLAVLPPSNEADYFTLEGSVSDLFWKSRLTGRVSWGERKQNEALVPFGTNNLAILGGTNGFLAAPNANLPNPANPAVIVNATDPALLGTNTSAGARIDTTLYDFSWNGRPADDLRLKARYRQFDYDNKSEIHDFAGRSIGDFSFTAAPAGTTFETEPSSWKKTTTTLQASWDAFKRTNITLEYVKDEMDRKVREVEHSNEDIWTLSSVTHFKDWLDIKSSASTARRRGDYDVLRGEGIHNIQTPGFQDLAFHLGNANASFTGNSPLMRKYDQSDRDRKRAQLQAIAYPSDDFTVTGFFQLNKDDFTDQFMGVDDTRQQVVGLDADWTSNQVTVNGFVTREFLRRNQNSRTWAVNATFASVAAAAASATNNGNYYLTSPPLAFNNDSNWSSTEETTTDTFGANVAYTIDPKKRTSGIDAGFTIIDSDGMTSFQSPLAVVAALDSNAFRPLAWPNLDDSRRATLTAKYHNDFRRDWSFVAGWYHERLTFSDFNKDGLQLAPTSGAAGAITSGQITGLMVMDTLVKPYNVDALFTTLTYKF